MCHRRVLSVRLREHKPVYSVRAECRLQLSSMFRAVGVHTWAEILLSL